MPGRERSRHIRPATRMFISAAVALLLGAAGAAAEDGEAPKLGWFDEAELSLVSTDGNSQAETFSLRNTLTRVWADARLKLSLGGLRAQSTTVSRTAVGTSAADARLVESSATEVTAERYYLEARYDRQVSDDWFWYAAAGWDRNEPAGVRNRTAIAAGVGNSWFDRQEARWRTDYGVTYTDQKDLVELPGQGGGFLGLRFSSDYWRRLTTTTEYTNLLTVDQNLDTGDDLRASMVNTLAVKMTDGLAIKLSHELQFDNQPSLIAVPIVSPDGVGVGEELVIEADDLDSTLSLALVVAF